MQNISTPTEYQHNYNALQPIADYAPVEDRETFTDWFLTNLFGVALSVTFHATHGFLVTSATELIDGFAPEKKDLIYHSFFALMIVVALTIYLRWRMTGHFNLSNTWMNIGLLKLAATHVWLTWSMITGKSAIAALT